MDFLAPFIIAANMLLSADPELMGIIGLSLGISFSAVIISLAVGLPAGAILASLKFPGRGAFIVVTNTFLGMPPVVVGLFIYVLISQSGPLGWMQILYTPYAMALAQTVLVLPISIALSRQVFETLNNEYTPLFQSLGLPRWQRITTLVSDGRIALITIALACFGRAGLSILCNNWAFVNQSCTSLSSSPGQRKLKWSRAERRSITGFWKTIFC